jgi:uncharacterized membrane protein YfcA
MTEWSLSKLAILFGTGCLAGLLNVLAGGGSFLTLPLLMLLGLPPGIANGTNRVAILIQNIGAAWSFDRHGILDRSLLVKTALPALVGGALGAGLALIVSDHAFKTTLAYLMLGFALWTLWSPRKKAQGPEQAPNLDSRNTWVYPVGFFLVGIYGGFIQAGVGFLVLAVTTTAGLDLVRGNALKVWAILCLTALSLVIFALNGRVDWPLGLALATGTFVGGLLGARMTVLKGHRWIRGFVTVAVVALALKLLLR